MNFRKIGVERVYYVNRFNHFTQINQDLIQIFITENLRKNMF